jgi:hypothetical protein
MSTPTLETKQEKLQKGHFYLTDEGERIQIVEVTEKVVKYHAPSGKGLMLKSFAEKTLSED